MRSKQSIFMKGAVERILDACTHVQLEDGPAPLDEQMQEKILANVEALAEEGLRVLGFASKLWNGASSSSGGNPERAAVEQDLVLYGLQGLYDPPRPETKASVKECHQAGVQVHMLTVSTFAVGSFCRRMLTFSTQGDHAATARAIALQVGILPRNIHMMSKETTDAMVMTAAQ